MSKYKDIQKAVDNFSHAMVDTLNDNIHKGGWEEMSIQEIYCRLLDEVEELGQAIASGGYSSYIPDEATDVANFAMMIFDNLMSNRDNTPMIFPDSLTNRKETINA